MTNLRQNPTTYKQKEIKQRNEKSIIVGLKATIVKAL